MLLLLIHGVAVVAVVNVVVVSCRSWALLLLLFCCCWWWWCCCGVVLVLVPATFAGAVLGLVLLLSSSPSVLTVWLVNLGKICAVWADKVVWAAVSD